MYKTHFDSFFVKLMLNLPEKKKKKKKVWGFRVEL